MGYGFRPNPVRMALSSWMTSMLPMARPGMASPRVQGRATACMSSSSTGMARTATNRRVPTAKAASRGLLFQNFRVKITGSAALQLKPWNSRDRHRVEKAMVAPAAWPP